MLNELLVVENGARSAGLDMQQRHPDIKDAGRIPTLIVELDQNSLVAGIRPAPDDVVAWTIRNGQHNSFPFTQPKMPLLAVDVSPDDDSRFKIATNRRSEKQRTAIIDLMQKFSPNHSALQGWLGEGLLKRVSERLEILKPLDKGDAAIVSLTHERFLLACSNSEKRVLLLQSIVEQIAQKLEEATEQNWVDVASSLLIGKFKSKEQVWYPGGGVLFEASGFETSIIDKRLIKPVTKALTTLKGDDETQITSSVCAITGRLESLVDGKFPQPNIAVLGQTFLFAKNDVIKATYRYGRSATDSMPVAKSTAVELAAAFSALTVPERRDLTWRAITGETPKQTDLLLAYVDDALDTSIVELIAEDGDFGESDSVAEFEQRTQRLVDSLKGLVDVDFRKTPVRVAIFRAVDPANRKVVYSGTMDVDALFRSAEAWRRGERNLPEWVSMPVFHKGERKPRQAKPPHVSPLGVISFSKLLFIRGGTDRQEISGLNASAAMNLFFHDNEKESSHQFRRVLKSVLKRRVSLLAGAIHAIRKRDDSIKDFDRSEVLRTLTILAILLHKLERKKEEFMSDAAFRFGQLLAGLDVVHAGYCADVRGGDMPPSLLGNQIFSIAQKSPIRALNMICRRWKPYGAWADRASRQRERFEKMQSIPATSQQGWEVMKALRIARLVRPTANELHGVLGNTEVTEEYRAELLLGYVAGYEPSKKDD